MITIPERMRGLDKDHRGYPIPFIVYRDDDNKPHFTINDTRKVDYCKTRNVCAVCGTQLFRARWFFGGPMSALHDNGAYIDPPMHFECMTFAASTCPYISSQKYMKRIDGATLDPNKATGVLMLTDPTMDPNRPKIFVAVMAVGQKYTDHGYIVPNRPYRKMQFWRDGKMIQSFEQATIEKAFEFIDRFK